MLGTRGTRTTLAATLAAALLTAGCGGDDTGPLTVSGDSFVGNPQPRGLWFNVRGCLADGQDGPVDVMITKITPTHVETSQNVELRVAWNPSREVADTIAPVGVPPAVYRPFFTARHSGGTLDACSLGIAVVLHPDPEDVVGVRGLDVTYEADGDTYTAHAEVDVALCPVGTKPASDHGCR